MGQTECLNHMGNAPNLNIMYRNIHTHISIYIYIYVLICALGICVRGEGAHGGIAHK